MLCKPGKHIRLVDAVGIIRSTAQCIESERGHSHNQVRAGTAQEHRASQPQSGSSWDRPGTPGL
ncbi:MAG TPA: hypothetical protein VJ830_06090, partial [Anaerolineales bacterium]|nr:hypothetical protein [Anaerolineales bacterium]